MAFRLRHWLMVAGGACAFVAVAKLPPEPFDGRRPRGDVRPEAVRYVALRTDAERARNALRKLRWADSLATQVLREAEHGWAAGITPSTLVAQEPVDSIRAALGAQVQVIPAWREDVVIGAYLVDAGFGDYAAADQELLGFSGSWVRETYLGERDGVTYCVNAQGFDFLHPEDEARRLASTFSEATSDGSRRHNHLGICRWVAEFGVPGPGVGRWLHRGGQTLAVEPTTERWKYAYWTPSPFSLPGRRRGIFGLSGMWDSSRHDACLAGKAAACAAILADPIGSQIGSQTRAQARDDSIALGAAAPVSWRYGWGEFTWRWVLADLYAEFGPEKVGAFWRSPSDDVLVAFRDAFDVDAGVWFASWIRGTAGYVPPGPLPRWGASLWAFAAFLAGAALAIASWRRRTVA